MTRSLPLLLLTVALLAGCGRVGALERKKGLTPPPVATGAARPQTPDEQIQPSTQARPQRNVDILYRSDKRPVDQFDIRPGANNGRSDQARPQE